MGELTKEQRGMITVLLAGAMLVVLNATLLSPALPHIMRDTGVSATTVQWLISAYSLTEATIIPLNAFFLGRLSTRKLFIGGLTWFAAACVIAATAPTFALILVARIMMACATGIIMPMTFTLIVLIIPREGRGAAMGLVGLIIGFAPAIGPSLSGVIVDHFGWRVLYAMVACIAVVIVLVAAKNLHNFEGFARVPADGPSVVLLVVGMVSLLYGISSITSGNNVVLHAALIVVGLVVLALFIRRQLHLDQPMLRVQVLSSRKFRTTVIILALLQSALIGSEVVLPIYVQQVMGDTATVSGLLMLPGAVIGAVVGLFAGRMFDRRGVRGLAIFGSLLLATGAYGITTLNMTNTILMVTLCYSTLSIGIQFLTTPINTWGVNSLDNSVVQHGNALTSTTNQIGMSIGTAFFSSLTALGPVFAAADATATEVTYAGVHVAFLGMATVLFVVAAAILLFVRDTKGDRRAAEAKREALARNVAPGQAGIDRPFLVGDVMNPVVNVVNQKATVRDAIDAMRKTETSGVPVVDDDGKLVAFISDGDIMKYLSRENGIYNDGTNYFRLVENEDFWSRLADLLDLNVMRIATKDVVSMGVGEDAEDAFNTLARKHIKKVPVVRDGKVVGSLSRRNIMNALITAEEISESERHKFAAAQ